MNPRKLNKRITLQQSTPGKDDFGGKTVAWADWMTVWASVRNLSGNERRVTDHGGQVAEARTEFIVRYRDGVTEQMRVSYSGKLYNIKHVNNVNEDNDMLVLTCDTGVDDG